ncbi:MAG: flagellar hook-length control protein FliK [bacterium]|nr:flagellar hook-length control protein FliK [bacterium]
MSRIDENNRENPAVREQQKVRPSEGAQSSVARSNPSNTNAVPFRTVLENTQSQQKTSYSPTDSSRNEGTKDRATEQAVRETYRDADSKQREKETRSREKERDSDSKPKDGELMTTAQKAKVAEKMVVARSEVNKHPQKDTSGGGRESMTQGGKKKPQTFGELIRSRLNQKGVEKKGMESVTTAQGGFQVKMASAAAVQTAQAVLPKQVMDQIVQYVLLMTRPDGKKEMEVRLNEKIYRGLKLRVSQTSGGKVHTTLMTSSEESRRLFESNRDLLKKHLAEKGIEIEEIDVILQA